MRNISWDKIKKGMDVAQFLIVLFGMGFTVYQINDMSRQKLQDENQLSSMYYDKLNDGTSSKISSAIAHNKKLSAIFKDDDLDNYLNILNDVGDRLNKNLLDKSIVCNDFYDITEKAYSNKEIKEYIFESRKEDPSYFAGFDDLHDFLSQSCID